MQNKANLWKARLNVTECTTKVYNNKCDWAVGENEPKQTQFRDSSEAGLTKPEHSGAKSVKALRRLS